MVAMKKAANDKKQAIEVAQQGVPDVKFSYEGVSFNYVPSVSKLLAATNHLTKVGMAIGLNSKSLDLKQLKAYLLSHKKRATADQAKVLQELVDNFDVVSNLVKANFDKSSIRIVDEETEDFDWDQFETALFGSYKGHNQNANQVDPMLDAPTIVQGLLSVL